MVESRTTSEQCAVIKSAIARARIANQRLRLGQSLGDGIGQQVAADAVVHNLSVISDAVSAIPKDLLATEPDVPWDRLAGMRSAIGADYVREGADALHRVVEGDLGAVDQAVERIRLRPLGP